MHLPVRCGVPRSAEEDPEASRRQDDAVRAAGRGLKGRSGQFGDIASLEDDGTLLTGEGEWLLAAATRRFFTRVAAGDVDFVSFFPQTGPNAGTFHLLIHNADRRIGKPVPDYRGLSGGHARLQSVHLFSPLAALPANPTERLPENNDTVLSLLAQGTGHRWGALIRFRDASGRLRRDLQGCEGSRFLLLQRHEGLLGARVRQLDQIRGCWEAYFFRTTEGRATLSTAR